MSGPEVGLIGDIGATNARFAIVQPDGSTTPARVYALNDYPSLSDAIDAYLAEESPPARPRQSVLAVASPVTGDQVTLTNHTWMFSIEALRRHVGLQRLRVINDFAANALAIPHLGERDRLQIGAGSPVSDAPIALIGPGTGLGVSTLVPTPGGAVPIAGEGGHVTMAPANAQEDSSRSPVGFPVTAVAASRAGNCVRFRIAFMVEPPVLSRPNGRFHHLRPGRSRAHGRGHRGLGSPCLFCMHALLGLEVQSKVSGQVTFVGQKMPLFPATPVRFAHNGLVGGSSP
jgi:Glucokinase